VPVIDPLLAPKRAGWVRTTVLSPFDVGAFAEDVRFNERTDVQAHPVVKIRVPADRLLFNRFPAHEDVVGRLAFEDQLEPVLKLLRLKQPVVGTCFTLAYGFLLSLDPVTEVSVGQLFKPLVIKLVVVDQDTEAILPSIPNLPDERAMMEQLRVLLKEAVAEPVFQRAAAVIRCRQ